MSTGRRWGGRASGNRGEELKRPEELDAFSIEHPRRPEVWIINRYAVVAAYVRIVLRGIGALALLWATVVLLGGFVSSLKKVDFWSVTAIAFIQAAGVFNAVGDAFRFCWNMIADLDVIYFWRGKSHHAKIIYIIPALIFRLVYLAVTSLPSCLCYTLSLDGLGHYAVAYRDASEANLKQALHLFYYLTIAHSLICLFHMIIEWIADDVSVSIISKWYGCSYKVLRAYLHKTKEMCENNPASIERWNLITYSVGLLDSELPEDYLAGGKVLNMLINQEKSLAIRGLLIRSPRPRIQKLIGTLAWRSPAEEKMRWHAARIVEHLAGHLNLALFPGALECISSLFDQEALLLTVVTWQGTDDGLVLIGLRILENLSHDTHNCTLIYRTNDLISKIVAPLSSNELIEDMKSSTAWTKVVDASLKVVSRLMCSSAMTGQEMCKLIANSSNAVKNLEAILDMKSDSGIIELQMRAVEVLTQLALHHPARSAIWIRENLIQHMLHIFLTTDWIADYLKDEKSKIDIPTTSQQNASPGEAREAHAEKKMKEAQETASQFKEKAGEALAMLSCDSEAIKSFTGCDDDLHHLTELLDSNIKTIECKISATDTMDIKINIGCRISAAVILKHLSNYVKAPTLRKVLEQLLSIQQDEPFTLLNNGKRTLLNNGKPRRLQAELLSLVIAIRANHNLNLEGILLSQTPPDTLEDLVVRLKKMADDNMYATPACLAIQKHTCHMVTEFIKHDQHVEVIDRHNIVATLLEASKVMAQLESRMLFAGVHQDCHGVPLKPLFCVLAKQEEYLLTQRKQALGITINIVPARVQIP